MNESEEFSIYLGSQQLLTRMMEVINKPGLFQRLIGAGFPQYLKNQKRIIVPNQGITIPEILLK
jgi:hypothetical protein